MAAVKLTKAQVRALRILAAHGQVLEGMRTREGGMVNGFRQRPHIHYRTARSLGDMWLAEAKAHGTKDTYWTWSIRSKGRQALAEHDAEAGDR